MIFVTVGTQKFVLDRLLKQLDALVAEGKITEPVFAQTGYSNYVPQNYTYQAFLNFDEWKQKMQECDIVISHGGVGSLLDALKAGKQVVAFPRLAKYGEHVDDHQLEICNKYASLGYLLCCNENDDLSQILQQSKTFNSTYKKLQNPGVTLCKYIAEYLKNLSKKN